MDEYAFFFLFVHGQFGKCSLLIPSILQQQAPSSFLATTPFSIQNYFSIISFKTFGAEAYGEASKTKYQKRHAIFGRTIEALQTYTQFSGITKRISAGEWIQQDASTESLVWLGIWGWTRSLGKEMINSLFLFLTLYFGVARLESGRDHNHFALCWCLPHCFRFLNKWERLNTT